MKFDPSQRSHIREARLTKVKRAFCLVVPLRPSHRFHDSRLYAFRQFLLIYGRNKALLILVVIFHEE